MQCCTGSPCSDCRRGVSTLADNVGEVVLCPLELVDSRSRRAIKQSVTVVESRGEDTARNCLRQLVGRVDQRRECDSYMLRCIVLHCIWRPSVLNTQLHGQVSQTFSTKISRGRNWQTQGHLENNHKNGCGGLHIYLLQMTSRTGCLPISTRSQAGETLSVVPRHSTRSVCFACSSAVDRVRFSKLSPKLMIVFDKYPSQPYSTIRRSAFTCKQNWRQIRTGILSRQISGK